MHKLKLALLMVVSLYATSVCGQQLPLFFDAGSIEPGGPTGVVQNVGPDSVWNTTSTFWVDSAAPIAGQYDFDDGDSVIFGKASAGTGSMSILVDSSLSSVSVGNMTIGNVEGLTYTFTGQRLTGTPTSTLLIDSNSAITTTFENSNGGANTFQNFTLNQGAVTGSASFSVSNSITLGSGSISNVLAGAATATKNSSGTITLSGANTYTGLTTVSAGTLQLSGAGTTGTGALTVNGSGTMNLGGQTRTVGAVNLGGTGTISNGTLTGTSYTSTGGTVSAVLAGTGTFTNTAGTTALSGANTYSGLTTISGGTVQLSGSGTTGTGALTVNGTGTLNLGGLSRTVGAVTLGGTGAINNGTLTGTSYTSTGGSVSAVLAGSGVFTNTSGTTTLSATNTYAGGTNVLGGTLNANSAGALGTGNVSVSSGATLNLGASDVISDTASLTVGGTLNVSSFNDTVGSLTLNVGGNITGSGTLTGSTFNLQSGNVTANLAGGSVAISNGATLDSNLTVGSGKTLSGAGTIDGNLVFSAGSFLAVDSTISTTLDLSKIIKVTGIGSTITLNDFTLANLTGVNWALKDAGTYTLISGAAGGVSLLGESSTINHKFDLGGGKFGYFQQGSLDLIITAVPEPSSMALVVVGAVGLAIRRRNRR